MREWLKSRQPAPPPGLSARLSDIAGDRSCADLAELSATLVESAAMLLRGLGDGREAATDLLAADALLTYALEAAAEDCNRGDAGVMSVDSVAAHAIEIIAATR